MGKPRPWIRSVCYWLKCCIGASFSKTRNTVRSHHHPQPYRYSQVPTFTVLGQRKQTRKRETRSTCCDDGVLKEIKGRLMDISSGLLQRAFVHKGEINKIVVVLTDTMLVSFWPRRVFHLISEASGDKLTSGPYSLPLAVPLQ